MVLISLRYLDGVLIKQIGLTIQGYSKKMSTTLTFLVICLYRCECTDIFYQYNLHWYNRQNTNNFNTQIDYKAYILKYSTRVIK